jgi:hypothetical protein
MFTATTTKKDFRAGVFQVTVEFTNGEETIVEAFNINSEEDMNNKIGARLDTLNRLLELENTLVLGAWTKKAPDPAPEQTPLQLAEQAIWELKRKIELGVLKETDQEFVDAVTAYKLLVSGGK